MNNLDYTSISKIKLLYASASRYGGDWHSSPHTHYCTEIFYVTEGNGQFQIEDKVYPVNAHDLVIVNPNVSHTELSHNANPLAYIVLGLEDVELSFTEDNDASFCIINLKEIKDIVRFYFDQIIKEMKEPTPDAQILCRNLTENLIIHLNRQANFTVTLAPVQRRNPRVSIAVRQYIDHHFKEMMNIVQKVQLIYTWKGSHD